MEIPGITQIAYCNAVSDLVLFVIVHLSVWLNDIKKDEIS